MYLCDAVTEQTTPTRGRQATLSWTVLVSRSTHRNCSRWTVVPYCHSPVFSCLALVNSYLLTVYCAVSDAVKRGADPRLSQCQCQYQS